MPNTDVALHPEGVDRNPLKKPDLDNIMVALHPEGVDRNSIRCHDLRTAIQRRPPPGGRG